MKDKSKKKKGYDYDEMEKDIEDSHNDSKKRKDNTGSYGSVFNDELEVPQFRCGAGEHVIDIIPYFAGKYDPHKPQGKGTYLLDIYVHKNVGAANEQFVCPSKNYKKPCPICEEIKRLSDRGVAYDDFKEDVAKRMNLYNIVCYDDDEEEEKGVQVWAIANFFMEDKLRGLAKNKRTGESIFYASPKKETGRSIAFEVKKKKGKDGQSKTEFLSHEFLKRDYTISKDILEQAVCLDEAITISSYEEIYEAYWGKPFSEKDNEKKKAKGRKRRDDDEEDDVKDFDDEDEDDNEDSRDRKKKHTRDDGRNKKHSSRKEDDEDDDDEDDDDEEIECPAKKGTFGVDCDQLPECKKCEYWDDCAKAHDEMESESSKKKKTKDDDEDDDDEDEKSKKGKDKKKSKSSRRKDDDEDEDDDDEDDDDEDDEDEKPKKGKDKKKSKSSRRKDDDEDDDDD